MKKVLYVTTISSTINAFLVPHIEMLVKENYHVDCACFNSELLDDKLLKIGCGVYEIPFSRNPLSIDNYYASKEIKRLQDLNRYDIVHVHTPVSSFITRMALHKENIKIIYTCHGFHFYKGAPLINWLFYYPLEKLAAKWTDILVTINSEDFKRAKNFSIRKEGKVELMHGVGIDRECYVVNKNEANELKKKLGLDKDDFIILILAELNKNKNHKQIIEAMMLLNKKYPKIKVLCAGNGSLRQKLINNVRQANLENNIKFLGYRNDIKELLHICDCVALFSKREGLGKCILEGMITEKILIATNTRGARELIENNKNGFLVEIDDYKKTAECIEEIYLNNMEKNKFYSISNQKIEKYLTKNVLNEVRKYY